MLNSPGPSFEGQVRRQGDPNFIFINAIPTAHSVRDHGIYAPSAYFEANNANVFHEPPKSDRIIPSSFHTYTPNATEIRRNTNASEAESNEPRPLTSLNSKTIQNKYGLGVRILEKTPRNSNSEMDRRPANRPQLGSDELSRTEYRVVEPPRMHTPLKTQTLVVESERVLRAPATQPSTMTSPIPNNILNRDPRLDYGGTVQRFEGFPGQQVPFSQQFGRLQMVSTAAQAFNPQGQSRINVLPLNLNSAENAHAVTPTGSLPRGDQRMDGGPPTNASQSSLSVGSHPSMGQLPGQPQAQFGFNPGPQISRGQSQPQEGPATGIASKPTSVPANAVQPPQPAGTPTTVYQAAPQINRVNSDQVREILKMNESKNAEAIITHHLPPAKDGPNQNQKTFPVSNNLQVSSQSQFTIKGSAAAAQPNTSFQIPPGPQPPIPNPAKAPQAAGMSLQAVQARITEVTQVGGELVSLTLEGIGSYEGTLRHNALNGYGKLLDPKGRLVYEGEFAGNQFEGLGVQYNHESGGDRLEARAGLTIPDNWIRYEGLFHANKRNGHGYLFYADGSQFSGEFEDGVAAGNGVLKLASGETVRGIWKNNLLASRN